MCGLTPLGRFLGLLGARLVGPPCWGLTYWKLKKTLYGLARSPKYWYLTLVKILTKELVFTASVNDPCLFKAQPFQDEPPIYLGAYVDDFKYHSASDRVENWFELEVKKHLTVDFMGPVSYFLGCRYIWYKDENLGQCCHISQPGFIESMLNKFGLLECNPEKSPYRSGLPIDQIPRDSTQPEDKKGLCQLFQSMMGCLTWASINTRLDIAVATSLLSQLNPSEGHITAAKHVMHYLKGTLEHGIRFCQHAQ